MAILSLTGKLQSGKDLTGKIIQYLTSNVKFPEDYSLESKLNNFGTSSPGHTTPWEIKKFATKLKMVASLILGVPVEKFEDNKYKDSYLPEEWDRYGYANGHTRDENDRPIMTVEFCDKERYEIEKRINWQTAYNIKMTVRNFLQRLGTEAVRNGLHTDSWVNALFADYKSYNKMTKEDNDNGVIPNVCMVEKNWAITDTRFPNEFDAIRKRQGICIKIHRPIDLRLPELVEQWGGDNLIIEPDENHFMEWLKEFRPKEYAKYNHISETAWENEKFDYTLVNDCDLETYVERVREMLQHFKIIN